MEGWIIITGATGAMGAAATKAVAAKGVPVIMACRNTHMAEAVKRKILAELPDAQLRVEELHLESAASVSSFVERIKGENIIGLFNNAGTMERHYRVSSEGFEMTTAVNYIGPYRLTMQLLPYFGSGAHIVNMVSLSCEFARFDKDFFMASKKRFSQLGSYSSSKLALQYFSIELAKRCPDLKINMADPFIVNSKMIRLHRWFDPLADIFFRPLCFSPKRGAAPAVKALFSDETGKYFVGRRCRPPHRKYLRHGEDARWLWAESERLLIKKG